MKWISVKDRMPEEDSELLVVLDSGVARTICAAWHRVNGNGSFDKKVTHWMPMPALPEIQPECKFKVGDVVWYKGEHDGKLYVSLVTDVSYEFSFKSGSKCHLVCLNNDYYPWQGEELKRLRLTQEEAEKD